MAAIATLTMNPALDVTTSVPRLQPTHKLRCSTPRFDPGGGGINVARTVRALGGDAIAVFPAGGGTGSMMQDLLTAAGVPFQAVPIAGTTRESMAVTDQESGCQYRFVLPGPAISDTEEQAIHDALAQLDARYLVVSGSLPEGTDEDFFDRIRDTCTRMQARLILDTSGMGLRMAGRAGAYLLKPSIRELEELSGQELPDDMAIEAAARTLIADEAAEVVVVSRGSQGAMLVTADAAERFAAVPVEPLSTVGAGDAMVAAITMALARGDDLRSAVRYGVVVGAATLLTPGTDLARLEDVERLLARGM